MIEHWWPVFWRAASPVVSILGLVIGLWGVWQRTQKETAVTAAKETIEGARCFLIGFKPNVIYDKAMVKAIEDQLMAIEKREKLVEKL